MAQISFNITIPTETVEAYFEGQAKVARARTSSPDWSALLALLSSAASSFFSEKSVRVPKVVSSGVTKLQCPFSFEVVDGTSAKSAGTSKCPFSFEIVDGTSSKPSASLRCPFRTKFDETPKDDVPQETESVEVPESVETIEPVESVEASDSCITDCVEVKLDTESMPDFKAMTGPLAQVVDHQMGKLPEQFVQLFQGLFGGSEGFGALLNGIQSSASSASTLSGAVDVITDEAESVADVCDTDECCTTSTCVDEESCSEEGDIDECSF